MTQKILPALLLALGLYCNTFAQSRIVRDFTPACDSLSAGIKGRSSVEGELRLKSVMKRGEALDFYFTNLGDYPWRRDDVKWFKKALKDLYPGQYSRYGLGEIYCKGRKITDFVSEPLGFDGNPSSSVNRTKASRGNNFVERTSEPRYDKGLSGRHVALWASHGRYYDQTRHKWQWQRPCLFQTVEDLYTSSYVLTYLIPMLENAGAYVMTPRERDTSPVEFVIDNDPSCDINGRGSGTYSETGHWESAGSGFADAKEIYTGHDNPFSMGTARTASYVPDSKGDISTASWKPRFTGKEELAVYISYKSLPNSAEAVRYIVRHLGGTTEFTVNQKIGGGTWIYLGTFLFGEGCGVTMDNVCPDGSQFTKGCVVCADAVKFGGGMGNIARNAFGDKCFQEETSGLPRYAEAARYWLQWAGMPPAVYSQNEMKDDYRDDLYSRGSWVDYLSGGSDVNPRKPGLKIPVDLSVALHSDAGIAQNDSIIGTLVIYSSSNEFGRTLPSGEPMMTSREFADIVQSQIVHDIRSGVDSLWTRRQIWDRGYRESRTPPVPTVLIESLSHQNFADMRFGLDPAFRFTFSRAVYKGMLKYLSNRYGCPYAVQPLPVHSFAAVLKEGNRVELSWEETPDAVEPTASAKGHILYTRTDEGGFDNGTVLKNTYVRDGRICTIVALEPGHIYSFRIAAWNDGGKSFPSCTLSAGIPLSRQAQDSTILVVDNFTRLSSPTWFDTPEYAGFDNGHDRGVPYIKDISFIGEMYERRKVNVWTSDENPGFGASYSDRAGITVPGNTSDYAYIHGKAVFEAGFPFCSASSDSFSSDTTLHRGIWAVDIICGKQVTTPYGKSSGKQRYTVFPHQLQDALKSFTSKGGNVLVSGEYIGTDIWDTIYPAAKDSCLRASSIEFAEKVLGYRWKTDYASRTGIVRSIPGTGFDLPLKRVSYCNDIDGGTYMVETPDGIEPSSSRGKTIFRYPDTGISAGVSFTSPIGYKVVSLGFPIEAIMSGEERASVISTTIDFFRK